MKKLMMFLFLLLFAVAFPVYGEYTAKIYKVYLHPSLNTGVTTSYNQTDPDSGVTVLVLDDGRGFARGNNKSVIDTRDMYGSWAFQMSGITPGQAAIGRGSANYSGVTFELWARTTIDTDMWDSGTTFPIFDKTAINSSTTPQIRNFPSSSDYTGTSTFAARAMRLELFLSGITPMDGLTGTLLFLPWR